MWKCLFDIMPEKINKKKLLYMLDLCSQGIFGVVVRSIKKRKKMYEYIFWDWRKLSQWRCHWGWHEPMGEKIIYFVDTTRMEFSPSAM